ncbi:MAG: hypothetical protein J5711_10675 [Bacteroidales bacterium]|nr:hypothetical protein [Bacteroidales bacterium]
MNKTFFGFHFFLFIGILSFAQDTIIFRNGDEVVAKVAEVSDSEIKYHLWNNQSGPIYVKKTSDIFMVKYEGGYKEVYGNNISHTEDDDLRAYAISKYGSSPIYMRAGYLRIGGRTLSREELSSILMSDELNTYYSAIGQSTAGAIMTLFGLAVGITGGILTFAAINTKVGLPLFIVGDVLTTVGIPLWAIGGARLNWVIDSYNNRVAGRPYSMYVEPRIMNYRNIGGHNTAYGLGLTLNF